MNNDEYNSLFKKAKNFADRYGFGEESEDFAQEYCIACLGDGKIRKLEWFLSDYSAKLRADKRVLGSPTGYLSKNIRVSIDQPLGSQDDDGPTIGDTLGVFRDDVELNDELRDVYELSDEIIGLVKDRNTREEVRLIYLNWLEDQA